MVSENYKICLKKTARDDILWFKQKNKRLYERCKKLIKVISDDPFTGIGKPERLKHFDDNAWSRRVDQEHRIVYLVYPDTKEIDIVSCRHHYS